MSPFKHFLHFVSAFISTAILLLFILFPLYHYTSVWKGYRILTVPLTADSTPYVQAAAEVGISGIASEESVGNRCAFLETGRERFPFTNVEHMRQWFCNEQAGFRYFYVPYTSLPQFLKLYFSLYSKQVPFLLEAALPYEPVQGILALVLFVYCMVCSRKRVLFFAATFSFLCYAWCVKSSLSLAVTLLSILTCACWLDAFEQELVIPWKQIKERIQYNIYMILLPVVPLVTAAIGGILPFCFFLLAVVLSITMLFSVYTFLKLKKAYQEQYREHPTLTLFAMHPQSWLQFWNTRYAITAAILTGCLLLVSALLPLIFSTNRLNPAVRQISVPQPISQRQEPLTSSGFFAARTMQPRAHLPDLSNYIEDCWYSAALPYLSVHAPLEPLTPTTAIRFDSFHEDAHGVLHRKEKELYRFDTAFIIRALKHERLKHLPLETMLIAQNGFIAASYQPLRIYTLAPLTSFFITIGALLFPCILIIMAKRR